MTGGGPNEKPHHAGARGRSRSRARPRRRSCSRAWRGPSRCLRNAESAGSAAWPRSGGPRCCPCPQTSGPPGTTFTATATGSDCASAQLYAVNAESMEVRRQRSYRDRAEPIPWSPLSRWSPPVVTWRCSGPSRSSSRRSSSRWSSRRPKADRAARRRRRCRGAPNKSCLRWGNQAIVVSPSG